MRDIPNSVISFVRLSDRRAIRQKPRLVPRLGGLSIRLYHKNGAFIPEQGKVLMKWEAVAKDLKDTGMFRTEMTANKAQMKFERMLSAFKTKYTNQQYNNLVDLNLKEPRLHNFS